MRLRQERFTFDRIIRTSTIYTSKRNVKEMEVPEVLFSGNHAKIAEWQMKDHFVRPYLKKTRFTRKYELSKEEVKLLQEVKEEEGC